MLPSLLTTTTGKANGSIRSVGTNVGSFQVGPGPERESEGVQQEHQPGEDPNVVGLQRIAFKDSGSDAFLGSKSHAHLFGMAQPLKCPRSRRYR